MKGFVHDIAHDISNGRSRPVSGWKRNRPAHERSIRRTEAGLRRHLLATQLLSGGLSLLLLAVSA